MADVPVVFLEMPIIGKPVKIRYDNREDYTAVVTGVESIPGQSNLLRVTTQHNVVCVGPIERKATTQPFKVKAWHIVVGIFAILFIIGLFTESTSTSGQSVSVTRVRIEPFVNRSNDRTTSIILCDITNNSSKPASVVWADITVVYEQGTKTYDKCCIYDAADHSGHAIQPGETYSENGDEGFIAIDDISYGLCSSASAVVTRVDENEPEIE